MNHHVLFAQYHILLFPALSRQGLIMLLRLALNLVPNLLRAEITGVPRSLCLHSTPFHLKKSSLCQFCKGYLYTVLLTVSSCLWLINHSGSFFLAIRIGSTPEYWLIASVPVRFYTRIPRERHFVSSWCFSSPIFCFSWILQLTYSTIGHQVLWLVSRKNNTNIHSQ